MDTGYKKSMVPFARNGANALISDACCKLLFSIPDSFIVAGITNYPIGVGINGAGEVTIADNHNNFNLSVFSQDGVLISALESKVKLTFGNVNDKCSLSARKI